MNYYIGSMAISDGHDILHYGVVGMKWGRRKYDYDGVKNPRRRRAMRIASRILEVKKDKKRISEMNDKQKADLKKAEKYWKDRAAGKKSEIKRSWREKRLDKIQSYSYEERAEILYKRLKNVRVATTGVGVYKSPMIRAQARYISDNEVKEAKKKMAKKGHF